jgi:hypothetical protein
VGGEYNTWQSEITDHTCPRTSGQGSHRRSQALGDPVCCRRYDATAPLEPQQRITEEDELIYTTHGEEHPIEQLEDKHEDTFTLEDVDVCT